MSEKVEALPEGWVMATIEDTGEYINGFAFKPGHRTDAGFPIIRIQNLTNELKPIYKTDHDVDETYKILDGDILVSWSATLDVFIWRRGPAYVNQHIFKVVPEHKLIGKGLLFYWLKIAIEDLKNTEHLHGSTMKHINRGPFMAHEIPIPPKNEQGRIEEKLDELLSDLDNGVAELKAAQIKLQQYRQSLLKSAVEGSLTADWRADNVEKLAQSETGEALLARILKERRQNWESEKLAELKAKDKKPPKNWQDKYPEPVVPDTSELPDLPEGWVWASLDMLIESIQSGKSFKCYERPPEGNDYGVVKVSAVTWGEYNESESKTCMSKDKENPEILIKEGDFLFSRANTTELVGACVIAQKVTKKIMLSDKIWRIDFVEESLSQWVLQFLKGPLGRNQIENSASGNQASMKNLSQDKVRSFYMPIAPKMELDFIADYLYDKFKSTELLSRSNDIQLRQSEAQRKNILKDAFSGKLVDQDSNDEPASTLLEKIQAERAERAKLPKLKRGKKKAPKVSFMETLEEVLKGKGDWIDAQDAFKACGVVDGTDTDRVEELYAELRKLDKAGHLKVERRGDYDMIKLTGE